VQIGTRVKRTEYHIRPKRDYWLSCGREPMKSGALDGLNRAKAERGTVIGIREPSATNPTRGLVVQIDGGGVENCLAYLWEVCE